MADEQAKNSANLGELFVEFGSKGMGGLIKGLNSVSASFLLTKNAGQQMLQPLANMSKQAGQGVVALDKLSAATGFANDKLQRTKLWAGKNFIDFGDYMSQIQNLQQSILSAKIGMNQAVSGQFARLGINVMDLAASTPEEALNSVRKAIRGLRQEEKVYLLNSIGMNAEMLYAMENVNAKYDERNVLTKKEQENLKATYRALTEVDQSWHSFLDRTIAKIGQKLIPLLDQWAETIKTLSVGNQDEKKNILNKLLKGTTIFASNLGAGMLAGAAMGSAVPVIGTTAGAAVGGVLGLMGGIREVNKYAKNNPISVKNPTKNYNDNISIPKQNEIIKPQAMVQTQVTPSALQNNNYGRPTNMYNNSSRKQEINIEVNQEIYGQDGSEIANDFTTNLSENIQRQMDNVQRNNEVNL